MSYGEAAVRRSDDGEARVRGMDSRVTFCFMFPDLIPTKSCDQRVRLDRNNLFGHFGEK